MYYESDFRGRRGYGPEYGRRGAGYRTSARARPPGRPARGYPPRAIHTYDLDYGAEAGGPGLYSGRAGYPTPEPRRSGHGRWSARERGGAFRSAPYGREYWLARPGPAGPGRYGYGARQREPWHWSAEEPSLRGRRGGR